MDERLAAPETHTQVIDGVVVQTMGANPPHAVQHAEVARIFAGCIASGYLAAVDMLTRVDRDNDRAADVSVFPAALDPKTGGRQLEELAFEVCDSERVRDVSDKARRFVARGVRRVFYVRVDAHEVYEWQRANDAWERLRDDDAIADRCFVVPIPVGALVQRVLADDTVAAALLARGNAVITAAVEAARRLGLARGTQEALLRLLARRGLALDATQRERVMACDDLATLERWFDRAVEATSVEQVFVERDAPAEHRVT